MFFLANPKVCRATGFSDLSAKAEVVPSGGPLPPMVARRRVRPFGRLVYVMPPYIISDASLRTLTHAICEVVAATP